MNNEYDIAKSFRRIEETLIKSMKRNLTRHLNEENSLDMSWSAWQTEQLKSLEQFKKNNKTLFKKDFFTINNEVEELIKKGYEDGKLEQEKIILESIQNGTFNSSNKEINKMWHIYKTTNNQRIKKKQLTRIYKQVNQAEVTFFKVNGRKLKALISETKENFEKAEMSILRFSNDQYRKIIYDAQVYANTGSGTIQQAVDMATKDFLSKGINSIEYVNGNMVNIVYYAEMAIRTANKRAYLQGEGAKRQEWGVHTVLVPNRGGGCPYCIKFQGRVFIDDVWSGGTAEESKETGYPLLSTAIKAKLFHPNCKDTTVTYFPEVSTAPISPTKEELQQKIENYKKEQKLKYIDRNIAKYKRLELGSTDKENVEKYHNKRLEWQKYKKRFKENRELTYNEFQTEKKNFVDITKDFIEKDKQDYILTKQNYYIDKDKNKYIVDGKNVVLEPTKREIEVAKLLGQRIGGQINIIPRVNKPESIKTPDYIINDERFDLKQLTGGGKYTIQGNLKGKEEQANNFIIDITNAKLDNGEAERQIRNIYQSKHYLWVDKIFLIREDNIIKAYRRKK